MKLGVNIDHIAVLREARLVNNPNVIDALSICDRAGADQITIHLREDRRHMQDKDIKDITAHSVLPINLECSISPEIIDLACEYMPIRATLVPEKREEVTTEGGLALSLDDERLVSAISKLQNHSIEVSLFIDPDKEIVKTAKDLGVEWVELHTGKFSNIWSMLYSNLGQTRHTIKELKDIDRNTLKEMLSSELELIKEVSSYAKSIGLKVAAGHGLNYQNVKEIVPIDSIEELNIGQAIVARSVFTGLEKAIMDMKLLLNKRC